MSFRYRPGWAPGYRLWFAIIETCLSSKAHGASAASGAADRRSSFIKSRSCASRVPQTNRPPVGPREAPSPSKAGGAQGEYPTLPGPRCSRAPLLLHKKQVVREESTPPRMAPDAAEGNSSFVKSRLCASRGPNPARALLQTSAAPLPSKAGRSGVGLATTKSSTASSTTVGPVERLQWKAHALRRPSTSPPERAAARQAPRCAPATVTRGTWQAGWVRHARSAAPSSGTICAPAGPHGQGWRRQDGAGVILPDEGEGPDLHDGPVRRGRDQRHTHPHMEVTADDRAVGHRRGVQLSCVGHGEPEAAVHHIPKELRHGPAESVERNKLRGQVARRTRPDGLGQRRLHCQGLGEHGDRFDHMQQHICARHVGPVVVRSRHLFFTCSRLNEPSTAAEKFRSSPTWWTKSLSSLECALTMLRIVSASRFSLSTRGTREQVASVATSQHQFSAEPRKRTPRRDRRGDRASVRTSWIFCTSSSTDRRHVATGATRQKRAVIHNSRAQPRQRVSHHLLLAPQVANLVREGRQVEEKFGQALVGRGQRVHVGLGLVVAENHKYKGG
ncbi:Protein HIR2 [Frankliniella fusca]|uniref:Protein HIR2 n=1 Tax=Frankliniella fusca TaxID=407009 RepID=A0AAE1L5S8_9NEOP|nr:Protein HIR2 [Frankliniella fusca]